MEKKVALVTGASRGIGRQISLTLAKEGMFVVVNYCGSEARAKNVLEEIRKNGGDGVLYQCDVADYQQTEAMAKELIKSYGHVDVLVNNAGITRDNLILRMSEEEFDSRTAFRFSQRLRPTKPLAPVTRIFMPFRPPSLSARFGRSRWSGSS